MDKKREIIVMYLTPKEKDKIEKLARIKSLTSSSFCRSTILEKIRGENDISRPE